MSITFDHDGAVVSVSTRHRQYREAIAHVTYPFSRRKPKRRYVRARSTCKLTIDRVTYTAHAYCSIEDSFNPRRGARLALQRASIMAGLERIERIRLVEALEGALFRKMYGLILQERLDADLDQAESQGSPEAHRQPPA